jgi:uncharacterized protein YjbJ (UPF0337 family)
MNVTKTISHNAETFKGTLKKTLGRVTGSRRLRAEGRTDQAKGDVKQAGTKARDASRH